MALNVLSNIDFNKNQILNVAIQVLASAPAGPVAGQVYYNSVDTTFYGWNGTQWINLGSQGAGNTDLSFSRDGSTVTVISSSGTNAILPGASTTEAGVMIATDKSKLDGIEALADVTDATNVAAAGATMDADTSLVGNGYFLDDDTMAANDATKVVSQQSLVAYVTAQVGAAVAGGMTYQGGYNASTNTPNLESGVGVLTGDTYTVTVAGDFFTEAVQVGDVIIANVDGAALLANWTVVNKNIPDIVPASETAQGIIELATQAEVNTGTDTLRAVTPATLQSKLGVTGTLNNAVRFTQAIGNGAATNFVVTHNIGRQFLTADVYTTAAPHDQILCEIEMDTVNAASFTFNVAPTSNQYTVVITG